MFGKSYESMYDGSMIGAGAVVFAVWGYAITKAMRGRVELNPKLLAFIIGETEERVVEAIAYLEKPDARSRCQEAEGRRLVREGMFQYFLPSWSSYRHMRTEDDLREYNRLAQQRYRDRHQRKARKRGGPMMLPGEQEGVKAMHRGDERTADMEADPATHKLGVEEPVAEAVKESPAEPAEPAEPVSETPPPLEAGQP